MSPPIAPEASEQPSPIVNRGRVLLLALALAGASGCSAGDPGTGGTGGGAGLAGCSGASTSSAACTSGVCLASKDCATCQDDLECATGGRCGTGLCHPQCSSAASCPSGWDCCDGRCIDPSLDPAHCGSCGGACAASSFCAGSHCEAPVLSALCKVSGVFVLLDSYPADNAASRAMAMALATRCGIANPVLDQPLAGSGALDPLTGEPLLLGSVLVAGGGGFGQHVIGWLEAHGAAPVVGTVGTDTVQYLRPGGAVVVSTPLSALGPSHDIFVVQVAHASGGALVLSAYGAYATGTTAASWYVVNVLVPALATRTSAWVVVDWTDTSGNGQPGADDRWTVVASGT